MLKKVIILFIGFIPLNSLRIFFYKTILKYKIENTVMIGMFNYIHCDECILKNSKIGSFNRIICKQLIMDDNSEIGNVNNVKFLKYVELKKSSMIRSRNIIVGTTNYFSPFTDVFVFVIGENSLLTSNHYLDCSGKIIIGSNVVFGGIGSEIWTHGFDIKRNMIVGDVVIGNNIYVGSRSMILQNVVICDNVSIGAGTIVSKSIFESGFYISSNLIRKSDCADYSNHLNLINYENSGYIRK